MQVDYGRKGAMLTLEVLFFSLVYLISTQVDLSAIPLHHWVLLMLAAYRCAHTVSYNEICEWLREPFCKVVTDSCRAGSNVHPRYSKGWKSVVGGLLACPICTGQWCALVLFGLYIVWPSFGFTLVAVLAIAGGYELLHYLGELLSWGGRLSRVASGKVSPDRRF